MWNEYDLIMNEIAELLELGYSEYDWAIQSRLDYLDTVYGGIYFDNYDWE